MEQKLTREQAISVVEMAAVSNINNLTADRIEALAGGHGMLNLSVFTCANVIIDALANGGKLEVKNANTKRLPMEDILEKCINVCKAGGCDPANAALLGAVMMYFAGSAAQVGIPAGNRKLGALARIIAGNDRCGVATIPTAKMNNRLSGFPAVQAVYRAMEEGTLTEIVGSNIPQPVAGSALYGHSALGEDYVYPQLASNGARIGTEAMIKAFIGSGMRPHPFTCALFGAAAILEIVHPDAEINEVYGPYGKFNSAMLAGRVAAETAGLPPLLHMRGTGEEHDTGRVIGDLALILKDVGGPSVIGLMAVHEIVAAFSENIAGTSGNATNSPLGHICGYAVCLMRALMHYDGDQKAAIDAVIADRVAGSFSPELALCSINILARKAAEIRPGLVTTLLIEGTEPARYNILHSRCIAAYDLFSVGKSVSEVVEQFDNERLDLVVRNASKFFTEKFGKPVEIKITAARAGARRKKSKMAQKYIAFDPYFDVDVRCGDQFVSLKGLAHDIVPRVAKGELKEIEWAMPMACPVCAENVLAGNHLFNIVVPVAMAAVMGICSVDEAADLAEKAAYVTAGIPGCKQPAKNVANLAAGIAQYICK